MDRLSLTVIGGFLGAGKTSLLNHWLRSAGGRRLAVLVNDFGSLNVDADLVAASAGDTIALTNGCVCCSIGDDLTAALIRVMQAQPPFDAVLIEASGVSDPWRIAQVGLADPGLALGGVIVLLDAAMAPAQLRDPLLADSLLRQLQAADLVLLNKIDLLASPGALAELREWLKGVIGDAPVIETIEAQVPLAVLDDGALWRERRWDVSPAQGGSRPAGHPSHADHAAGFDTWSTRPAAELRAADLRALLRSMPVGVLRLKGLLRTDDYGWAELQFAGRHGSLRRARHAPAGGQAALVAIGLKGRLPVEQLQSALQAASLPQ